MPKGIYLHKPISQERRSKMIAGIHKYYSLKPKIYRNCKFCNKKFIIRKCELNIKFFCSKKCSYSSKRGKKLPDWWKEKIRKTHRSKIPYNWKGENANYCAKHALIYRYKGKPQICIHCEITCKERKLSWANINHKYSRNLDDYISLCSSCHRKYDYKNNLKSNNKIGTNQFSSNSYQIE